MQKVLSLLIVFVLILSPAFVLADIATTTESVNVSVTIEEEVVPEQPPPGVPWPPSPTKVIFQGRAYPNAFLTILKNGSIAATFFSDNFGFFEKEITGIAGGRYAFGIWAEDSSNRKSVTLNFTIDILQGATTRISGISLSPTIEINPTQLERGQILSAFGQSFPGSTIQVFISPKNIIESVQTSLAGDWFYQLSTQNLEEGEYSVKAKAIYQDGKQSEFSQDLPFLVLPKGKFVCWGADLNFDGFVDIIDFSILLYFWDQTNPANPCADINFDGTVDIFDFSIMMYWWTD